MEKRDFVQEAVDEVNSQKEQDFKKQIKDKVWHVLNLENQVVELKEHLAKHRKELRELELKQVEMSHVLPEE
jgi:hypothetical protein